MSTRAKRFDYAVTLGSDGALSAETGPPLAAGEEWTPEHLVLAGLAMCTMKSLEYSATRAGSAATGEVAATGVVTRREDDGRFALVEVDVRLNVAITPPPQDLPKLLSFAERGCFVGASLRATPRYHWTVNDVAVSSA